MRACSRARSAPCLMCACNPLVRVDYRPHALDHCTTHVQILVERVQAGALLLFDRGSFRFAFFDQLSSRGIWWISRYAHQASYHVSHICSQADGVFDAIVSPSNRSSQPSPVSRALDPLLAPWAALSLPDQCARPARAEAFGRGGLLCAQMGDRAGVPGAAADHLNLNHLWSAKGAVVHVQLWCCLIPGSAFLMLCTWRLPDKQAWTSLRFPRVSSSV